MFKSLYSLRQKDRENRLAYLQYLDDMKKRVESRPLLLEQVSQSALESAKSQYIACLRNAGLSEDEAQAILEQFGKEQLVGES